MTRPQPEFIEFLLGQMTPLGDVQAKAMFGGYGIYHDGDMFARIALKPALGSSTKRSILPPSALQYAADNISI